MRISDKQIERLREIYRDVYGLDITFDEAEDLARRLITLFLTTWDEKH